MPLLAGLIKSLFAVLIGWLGTHVTKRMALALAVSALFVSLTGALVLSLSAAAEAILVAMPSFVAKAACWFWPDNGNQCISAMMAASAVRWAYDINVKVVQIKWGDTVF